MPPSDASLSRTLPELIARFAGKRVLVIGDLIADEFVYGRVARVSREAPVLILEYDSTQVVPGGAGNAASNVAALGGEVRLVATAGRDTPGDRVVQSLPPRVSRQGVLRPAGVSTTVKTRILAGGIHSAKQQVVRIDRLAGDHHETLRRRIERTAVAAIGRADAVLISDYGLGVAHPSVASVIARALAARGRQIPVLVDSRYNLLRYRRLTACAPNESEVEQLLGVRIGDQPRVLERAGRALLRRTGMKALLITRGSRGIALFESARPTVHIPIHGSDEIADVTGAGDTVMATVTLALAAGGTFEQAARLANYAGGLVVMKRGTATVTASELLRAVRADAGSSASGARS